MSELETLGNAARGQRVSPRHADRGRQNALGGITRFVGFALVCVLVAGAAVGAVVFNTFNRPIQENVFALPELDGPPPDIGAIEGGFNILIVGSDTREGSNNVDGSDESGVLNDVNILIHVAQDQQSAVAVSFPRDMRIDAPECAWGYDGKINSILYWGGMACVVQTISEFAGVPIQYAGMITFSGVVTMSDAIGGVEVCVNGPVVDWDTGINLPEAGYYTLSGWQALAFLRTRGGVGDGSDWSRVSSQQVYLSSLIRKIKSEGVLTDLSKVFGLAQAAVLSMSLSESMANPYTMVSMALALKNIPLNRVTFVQYPTYGGDTSGHGYAFPDTSNGDYLFELIRNDQPFQLAQVGDDRGSEADGNKQLTEEEQVALADNSSLPVLDGVTGQTAADFSCSVSNS